MIDFIKKLIRFALLLLMDFDSLIEEYLGRFHAEELKSCEPNEDRGKNRCVYENHLDDKEYVDRGNNPNGTTIKSIICPDREHDQEKQILCISAAPGYGKEFFAKRLCLLDYKAYYDTQHKGRVPFIIKSVDVDSFEQIRAEGVFEGYEPLCALCTISMNRVLQNVGKEIIDQVQPFKANKFILRKLLKRLEQLLSSGQLFVLFEKEVNIQSVRELTRTFCVIPEDLRDLVQKNLLVFVFDDGRLNPFNYGAYSVVLFRLSNQDVIRHIEFCTQGNSKIVEEFKHLVITIPALNIPDCLLFITETHLGNLQNIKQAKTAAGLYQDCIRCVIENRSEDPEERQRTRDHLQNQAMSSYYEKYGYTDFGVLLSSEERELLCAQATRSDHLLHDDGQFRFEGCRDYLIAEKLYWMLQDDRRVEQTRNLLRCTDDNIMKRLIEIVVQDNKKGANVETSVSILEEIWSNLISPDRAAAGTSLEILTYFMEHIAVVKGVDKEEAFIKQIRLQMSKPVYDGNIFELISKADSSLSGLKINEKLKKIYLDSVRNRDQNCDWKAYEEEDLYNRRFLFYLGVYGELTTDVLEGLTNSYLHPHVKYHLARAMVNNASKSEHKKLVRDTVIKISNEVIAQGDIILKSYMLILKCLLLNYTIPDKEILATELCEKLHSEEYWLRAHAADALGHLNDLSIPDKLLSALSNELNRTEEENNTKLKVVNYTVEAICEFFYFPTLLEDMFQKDSANRREVLQETAVKMSQLINVDKLKQLESREMAMSAYAAIAEGVLYLRRGAFKERPSFSGKHIKDTIKQLDENAKLIENALDGAAKWGGENKLQAIVRDFRNVIEQVKNEVVSSSGTDEIDAQIVTQDASGQGTQDAAGTVVPTTICTQINILSKEEAHVSMNNYHFGEVKGLQIISDNGQGTQFNSIQGGCNAADTIRAIRELLQSNCTPQQREAAEPVIQELFTSAEQGSLAARDRESWLKKLASALAIGASASTIMQAPWWGTLAQTVQQFFTGL